MSDNPAADKDWEEAEFRAQVLAKLPDQLSPGTVEWAMGHLEISRATLFRPLKQFRADGRTRALLPDTRGPKPGMLPMDPDVEAIVSDHFRDFYATRRKPTKTEFWREVVSYATPPAQPCRTCWVLSGPRHWRRLPKPVLQFSMRGRAGKGRGPWGQPKYLPS
jgi:hypothetical protein